MAFFNELSGKIRNAGQSIAQSTKNFADITRLKDNISNLEKQILELYSIVGKGYYDRHKNDPNTEDKENINAINSLFEQISDLKQKIKEIEGITKCPNCGADVPNDASFCNNCGYKMFKETADSMKCPNCGADIPNDSLFCTSCGNKIVKILEKKICANCGSPLAEGNMFCANCGAKVEQEEKKAFANNSEADSQTLCPQCHTVLTEEDVFCPECGTPINKKAEANEYLPENETLGKEEAQQ